MKRIACLLCILSSFLAKAQINILPIAGINSTRVKLFSDYRNGGNYGLAGFEVELRKKPARHKPVYFTLITGLNYLKNGCYYSFDISIGSLLYTQNILDHQTEYWQAPVVARINWQPFPLVEDWHVFFGAGINNSFLIKAHLREEYTNVIFSTDAFATPVTTHLEDGKDVTELGKKHSLFSRFELGMRYKRIQVIYRLSLSVTDMYYKGLENQWNIPAANSEYLRAQQLNGKIKEKYSELVVGYRIFK